MSGKQVALSLYVFGIVVNLYNLYNSFVFELKTLGVFSVLCVAGFTYMTIQALDSFAFSAKEPPEPKRVPCTYPMNEFYNFEDEVPDGSRCSTVHDCLQCDEMDSGDCELRQCLIEDGFQSVTESGKWKKCFNRCPACDAGEDDIEWGSRDSDGTTTWQEAVCNLCDCEFQEVFDYTSTMVK